MNSFRTFILSPKVTVHKTNFKKELFPRKLFAEIRYLCSVDSVIDLEQILVLDLLGIGFHAVVIFGLGKDFLLKSILGPCVVEW